jgi:hypothetical protein
MVLGFAFAVILSARYLLRKAAELGFETHCESHEFPLGGPAAIGSQSWWRPESPDAFRSGGSPVLGTTVAPYPEKI